MNRVLLSLIILGLTIPSVIGLSRAFFSDTEVSPANNFTAGKIDLKVNGVDNPQSVVSFADLKPGDDKFFDKDLFVDFNPAQIWVHIKSLEVSQGTMTEPEDQEENGTPKFDIQNYITYDLSISSPSASTIIDFADDVSLPDAVSCWIPIGTIPGNTHVTLVQSFHFDETVTNWAQGDTLDFAEEFLAQQVNDPTIPNTGSGRIWDPELKHCVPNTTPTPTNTPTPTPIACLPAFASTFEQVAQGTQKSGAAVLASRSNGNFALGAPQSAGTPVDNPVVANSFFSLGFTNGSIVLKFTSPFIDQPGTDLSVYEVTGATNPPYPDELVKVEVSSDGSSWTTVAAALSRDANIDINPVASAQYVRLTDVSNIALFTNDADGYDLDAIRANCTVNE